MLGVQGGLYTFRPYDPTNRLWDPATDDGAVLDLGVYAVSMTRGLLGTARDMHCAGRYTPNGVKSAMAISISHIGGGTATLTCGFDIHGPGRMTIFETKGWVEIQPRFHHPTIISVHHSGVLPWTIEAKQVGKGYAHELVEVSDCLLTGRTQSVATPLADTVKVMRVLESCLKQLGRPQEGAKVKI